MDAIRYILSNLLLLRGIFYNGRINNIIYCVYYKRYQFFPFFFLALGLVFYYCYTGDKICKHILFFLFSALKFWALLARHCWQVTGGLTAHLTFLLWNSSTSKNKQLFLLVILWRKSAWILQEIFLIPITNNINCCWYYGGLQWHRCREFTLF